MDNYRIITDINKLEQFIDWLPELEPDETYYLSLLARNKYCKDIVHIRTDVQQCRRFVTDKARMINKIKQLECEIGSYTQGTLKIPQEALALYIHPNPRSQTKAMQKLLRNGLDLILKPYSNYNVNQEALSSLQQSVGYKAFVDFDFDCLEYKDFAFQVYDKIINKYACSVVKTRGGFHALVTPEYVDEKYSKSWYVDLSSLIDDKDKAVGDLLMPVPGCTQGNFTPYFLTIDGIEQ